MFDFIFKKNSDDSDDNKKKLQLGQGFYLTYEKASNHMDGFRPVNIVLKNSNDKECNYRITSQRGGIFMKFPGVEEGHWREGFEGGLLPVVFFDLAFSEFYDGISYVQWEIQPDGRYFEDEDGFGAEHFPEIWLYSAMNTKGEFIQPFTEKYPEGFIEKCKICRCLR